MKTLLELDDKFLDCRFPVGDMFCGDPVQDKSSYCPACHAISWVKPISTPAKARVYHGTDFAA